MNPAIMVITNLPGVAVARYIANLVLEERLVACVNILPGVQSIYRWNGKVEEATEVTLLMKTTQTAYPSLEAAIKAAHPYDVPEIIALPIVTGLSEYLMWVATETVKGTNE